MIVIIPILLSVWLFNNSSLPESTNYHQYFRMFDVCVLMYVIVISFRNSIFKQEKGLSYTLIGYSILLSGQVALTLFSLQGGFGNAITAYVAKDVGLLIFVKILRDASGLKSTLKKLKTEYS
jgi:hypothetical protein